MHDYLYNTPGVISPRAGHVFASRLAGDDIPHRHRLEYGDILRLRTDQEPMPGYFQKIEIAYPSNDETLEVAFLTAPCKGGMYKNDKKTCRLGINPSDEVELILWLYQRAHRWGFIPMNLSITNKGLALIEHPNRPAFKRTFVEFVGTIKVFDAEKFRNLVDHGHGDLKYVGLGFITLLNQSK